MTEKIMKVFYDANGLPYKDKAREVHYPLVGSAFMGASNTTQIRFYVGLLGNSNDTWVSCAKLPNGQLGYKMLSATYDSEESEYYVSLSLTTFYTQYKGDVYIALQGYQSGVSIQETSVGSGIYKVVGTPTIQATGVIKLAMNYTPQISPSALSEDITASDIQEFLSAISTGIGSVIPKISSSNIASYDFDINLFHENEIVFNDYDNVFYKLVNDNGTLKPFPVLHIDTNSLDSNTSFIESHRLNTSVIKKRISDSATASINITDNAISITESSGETELLVDCDRVKAETPNHEISIDEYDSVAKVVSKDQNGGETGLIIDDDRSVNLIYEHYDSQSRSYISADRNISMLAEDNIYLNGTRVTKNDNEISNEYICVGTIDTSSGSHTTNSTDKPFIQKLPSFIKASLSYNGTTINLLFRHLSTTDYISERFEITTSGGVFETNAIISFSNNYQNYSVSLLTGTALASKQYVDDKLVGVYKIHGSASVDDLNSMTKTSELNGSIYNVHTDGVLVNYDGSTVAVHRGDNVLFVWHGGNWVWDDLAGFVDTSNFVLKSTTIAGNNLSANISSATLTDSLVFATNSEIDALFE